MCLICGGAKCAGSPPRIGFSCKHITVLCHAADSCRPGLLLRRMPPELSTEEMV